MMGIESITLSDLMQECNYNDKVEFRKILRRNNLPLVSDRKPIKKPVADQIVEKITGHRIDWYKYKVLERDITEGGPLQQNTSEEIKSKVQTWYDKYFGSYVSTKKFSERFIGLVCQGGFLEGTEDLEFSMQLDRGINVLIGDRGSGKSTVLNLLGLLADSVGEETQELVKRLLVVLNPEKKLTGGEETNLARRTREKLSFYSVKQYANYFLSNNFIYCYYVNLVEHSFDCLKLENGKWKSIDMQSLIKPSILFFPQGEVVRIAEAEDGHNYKYLNNLLDAIYPDLYEMRSIYTNDVKSLVRQYEYFNPSHPQLIKPRSIYRFLDQRYDELRRMRSEIEDGYFSDESINQLQFYIDGYYEYRNYHHDGFRYEAPFLDLLEEGEISYFYLYVSRIIKFLTNSLSEIIRLHEARELRISTQTDELDSFSSTKNQQNKYLVSDPKNLGENIDSGETIRDILDPEVLKELQNLVENEIDSNVIGIYGEYLDNQEYSQSKLDSELFSKTIENTNIRQVDEELLAIASQVVDFLWSRLRFLSSVLKMYRIQRPEWNDHLSSLVTKYCQILKSRIKLIESQEEKCSEITDSLNRDEMQTRIYTIGGTNIINEYEKEILSLSNVGEHYSKLMEVTVNNTIREILEIASAYDTAIEECLVTLENMKLEQTDGTHDYIFNPIGIDLMQGSIYRKFDQLSFGQKSGIILKMVLATTDKEIIVIDQPEDNLDAYSIVNMLAPTLNRLAKEKQVIVVTHDSNLVMGMEINNLVVLQSFGEHGRIKIMGTGVDKSVVEEMIYVLEGGIHTFETKMKIYEDFVTRVRGAIHDITIMEIESSFRRRTIDELRNYLQPIVSDKDLLSFLRHELIQKDPATIHTEVLDVLDTINRMDKGEQEKSELLRKLERLSKSIDNHITRFKSAVDEIRLMDIYPKHELVHLNKLLINLREEYVEKLGGKRDVNILIDTKLENTVVWADLNHLRLIFRNLISNSLRATEARIASSFQTGIIGNQSEMIEIKLDDYSPSYIRLIYQDNGRGMPIEIQEKLYKERCSTKKGKEHGLGGVIIRKLLDLNNGSIEIIESIHNGDKSGTIQQIILCKEIT